MNKKSFIDNIDDETLAEIIDITLKREKRQNHEKKRFNIIKIIPAVAMILFMAGIVSVFTLIANIDDKIETGPESIGQTGEPENVYEQTGEILSFVPPVVEKEFFENRILAAITNQRDLWKMESYYTLKEPSEASFNDPKVRVPVYVLDPNITERELNNLLEYYQEYTDLTSDDIMQMYTDFAIPYENYKVDIEVFNERYAHVRFGATKDILLLDVEWFTEETFLEYIEEFKLRWEEYLQSWEEYLQSDEFMQLSDGEKKPYINSFNNFDNLDVMRDETLKVMEQTLNKIKNGTLFYSRTVNGKTNGVLSIGGIRPGESILDYLDDDGYYSLNIYPYIPFVHYYDENGVYKTKDFGRTNSKYDYERILTNEIIPFCDDLLAKELITQEQYDIYTVKDPLDYYVNNYFN